MTTPELRPHPTRGRRFRRFRAVGSIGAIALVVLAGCGGSATTPGAIAPNPTVTIGTIVAHQGPREPIAGFSYMTIIVTAADGSTQTWCVLLADTEPRRQQGLMNVTDPSLGGFDGMLFAFSDGTTTGFWMKDTILPLSIAFLRPDGTTLSMFDMEPCPADAKTCPTYPSGGAYRNAIEVPKGELGRLGISATSKVTFGDRTCTSPEPAPGSTVQR